MYWPVQTTSLTSGREESALSPSSRRAAEGTETAERTYASCHHGGSIDPCNAGVRLVALSRRRAAHRCRRPRLRSLKTASLALVPFDLAAALALVLMAGVLPIRNHRRHRARMVPTPPPLPRRGVEIHWLRQQGTVQPLLKTDLSWATSRETMPPGGVRCAAKDIASLVRMHTDQGLHQNASRRHWTWAHSHRLISTSFRASQKDRRRPLRRLHRNIEQVNTTWWCGLLLQT